MKYKLPVAKRELQNRVRKWRIQGRGPGGQGSALFLGQTEVRRAEKNFVLKPSPHPPLPPTLSPGLHDRTLKVWIRQCM